MNDTSSTKSVGAGSLDSTAQTSMMQQLVDFTVFLVAVLASRFLDLYAIAVANPLLVDWKYLLFALIVSLAAFPIVYEKAMRSKNSPRLVQIALIFTTGLGWEKMVSAVSLAVPK